MNIYIEKPKKFEKRFVVVSKNPAFTFDGQWEKERDAIDALEESLGNPIFESMREAGAFEIVNKEVEVVS